MGRRIKSTEQRNSEGRQGLGLLGSSTKPGAPARSEPGSGAPKMGIVLPLPAKIAAPRCCRHDTSGNSAGQPSPLNLPA